MKRVARGGSVLKIIFAVVALAVTSLGFSSDKSAPSSATTSGSASDCLERQPSESEATRGAIPEYELAGANVADDDLADEGRRPTEAHLSAQHHRPVRCCDPTAGESSVGDSLRTIRLTRSLDDASSVDTNSDRLSWFAAATSTLAASGLPRPTLSLLHVRLQI